MGKWVWFSYFFAQYFTTATLALVTELCLSLPERKGEIQMLRKTLWNLFLKSECHYMFYCSPGHWKSSRSTTDDQAAMCPIHPPMQFTYLLYPHRYFLSYLSKAWRA